MEDFTLPSVGARFKKWECCTPILPKCQAHPQLPQKTKKIQKNSKKGGQPTICGTAGSRLVTSNRLLVANGCPKLHPGKKFPPLLGPKFLHMWLTLPHWLQHMPALPRLLLKTSNIHNFLSVGSKNTIFVLLQSLL
jgi:hypothetical protein